MVEINTMTPDQITGPNAPASKPVPQAPVQGGQPNQQNPAGQPPSAPDPSAAPAGQPNLGVQPPADPNRPAWLPAKFKTPEELAKSYTELESKVGKPAADKPAESGVLTLEELDAYSAEFNSAGGLSPESYEKLAKKGLQKELVDGYIEGVKARSMSAANEAMALVGGEDQYKGMVEWAGQTLSDAELAVFNDAVDLSKADKVRREAAIKGLFAQYQLAGGQPANPSTREPARQLTGQSSSQPATGSMYRFESRAQVVQAMRDPRYKTDPAYQKAVADALGASDLFGQNG